MQVWNTTVYQSKPHVWETHSNWKRTLSLFRLGAFLYTSVLYSYTFISLWRFYFILICVCFTFVRFYFTFVRLIIFHFCTFLFHFCTMLFHFCTLLLSYFFHSLLYVCFFTVRFYFTFVRFCLRCIFRHILWHSIWPPQITSDHSYKLRAKSANIGNPCAHLSKRAISSSYEWIHNMPKLSPKLAT